MSDLTAPVGRLSFPDLDEPDHVTAARELRAMVDGLSVKMECRQDTRPVAKDDWKHKANAASVHCAITAPRLPDAVQVDYSAGIGIWLPALAKGTGRLAREIRDAGRPERWTKLYAMQGFLEKCRATWKPEPFDVIAACLRDSDALDYDGDFEAWASDTGFDPDSRKGEKTFRECERIGRAMKRLFGADFQKARELASQL